MDTSSRSGEDQKALYDKAFDEEKMLRGTHLANIRFKTEVEYCSHALQIAHPRTVC